MRIAFVELFGILIVLGVWAAIIVVIVRVAKYLIRYGIDYYLDQKEKRAAAHKPPQPPADPQ